jgi:hypothetical protein
MFLTRPPGKIFCIGFNKTGTTSLHSYFRASRLSSLHSDKWPHWSFDTGLKSKFRRWTCYSDGEQCNFRNLEAWYPRSVFVLNTRAVRPWIRSRIKHVMRLGFPTEFERGVYPPQFGKMAREFFTAPEAAIDKWLLERSLYHQLARRHFQDRINFIELDVTADKNWESAISEFLRSRGFRIANTQPEAIRANVRTEENMTDQAFLHDFFTLGDARIEAISRAHSLD